MRLQTYEDELLAELAQYEQSVFSLDFLYTTLQNFGNEKQIQLGLRSLLARGDMFRLRRGLYASKNVTIDEIIWYFTDNQTRPALGLWGLYFHSLGDRPEAECEIIYASPERLRSWRWQGYQGRFAFLPELGGSTAENIWLWSWNLKIGDPDTLLKLYPKLGARKLAKATQSIDRPLWTARMGFLAEMFGNNIRPYRKGLGRGHTSISLHPTYPLAGHYHPNWKVWSPWEDAGKS